MGLFDRKKNQSASASDIQSVAAQSLSVLNLAPVDWWATWFLEHAGLDARMIEQLREEFPTPVPPPNLEHVFFAGDPSNPWTLSVACAEQAVYDALHTYAVVVVRVKGRNTSAQAADTIYAAGGLEALVGYIWAHDDRRFVLSAHEHLNKKIRSAYSNFFAGMLAHYLSDYWPERKYFRVRLNPA